MNFLRHARIFSWLALCGLLGACVPRPAEYVPKPEDLLPPSYAERKVPQALLDELNVFSSQNQGWARAFVCRLDWEGVANHVDGKLLARGYTRFELPPLKELNAAGVSNAQFIRDYVSEQQTLEIVLVNVKVVREKGGQFDSTADYVLIAGRPDIAK